MITNQQGPRDLDMGGQVMGIENWYEWRRNTHIDMPMDMRIGGDLPSLHQRWMMIPVEHVGLLDEPTPPEPEPTPVQAYPNLAAIGFVFPDGISSDGLITLTDEVCEHCNRKRERVPGMPHAHRR